MEEPENDSNPRRSPKQPQARPSSGTPSGGIKPSAAALDHPPDEQAPKGSSKEEEREDSVVADPEGAHRHLDTPAA